MKNRIIVTASLVVLALLVGFVPEFIQVSTANSEIVVLRQQLAQEKQARALADFRNAAAVLYTETAKSNFSTAANEASRFFTDLRRFTDQAPEPLRQRLNGVLANRDPIIAAIAKTDPGSATLIQSMFLQMQGL